MVLGSGGMVGQTVSLYLREKGVDIDTLSARKPLNKDTMLVDVRDIDKLENVLKSKTYDVVVNCIGLLVKESDRQRDLAVYLNSYLPRYLENHYKDSRTKLITIGTDGVFSECKSGYSEKSLPDGESFYARTKALGEIDNQKDLTFRTSLVGPDMSRDGIGLFNWFYDQTGEIPGYTDAMWNGITSLQLAKGILASVEQNLSGIYHLVQAESISKFALLGLFQEVFGRDDIRVMASKGSTNGARLINTRMDFQFPLPDYKTMICDTRDWIKNHPKLYEHYER